ncbi:hypothetical protein GOODEAATRI_008770 [Goodea atripinnis]|uniref:Uncharacterized protein n=1 Tax=Goodea atripinnis TaxID=208336 RepID=A0ABV0NSZ0_9TELE
MGGLAVHAGSFLTSGSKQPFYEAIVGGGQSIDSTWDFVSVVQFSCFLDSWQTSAGDFFTSLPNPASVRGLFSFGGTGGTLQCLKKEGVPCVRTTSEETDDVFAPERISEFWHSEGEAV